MPMLQNLVGLFSQQYIDKVCGTEALTGSVNRRQQFLRRFCPVPGACRRQATVTVATVHVLRIAEVRE